MTHHLVLDSLLPCAISLRGGGSEGAIERALSTPRAVIA